MVDHEPELRKEFYEILRQVEHQEETSAIRNKKKLEPHGRPKDLLKYRKKSLDRS